MNASSPAPSRNPLTTYLRLLRQHKLSLPQGQLVCVSASPNISTVAALLRLACAVGPYIAVLQVHADIIDDWSADAVRKLTSVAKKFGFLIWEGGRILNSKRRPFSQATLSSHEVARDIAMARKRYTGGIGVATWAGLVSTWVIGSEEEGKGSSQFIPTLRRAARETMSRMAMSVRTEISGGQSPVEFETNGDGSLPAYVDHNELNSFGEIETIQPLRKSSVISLTRTITQHEEPSQPAPSEPEYDSDYDTLNDQVAPSPNLPSPPLLSRGVVLCLPNAEMETTRQHRDIAIASAKANDDFVLGFVTEDSWIHTRENQALADALQVSAPDEQGNEADESNHYEQSSDDLETYVVFSPLENEHVSHTINITDSHRVAENPLSPKFPVSPRQHSSFDIKAQQISALHHLIGRALSITSNPALFSTSVPLNSPASTSKCGNTDILYIPVVTMNV
ncbi:hypothetical protein LOZ11_003856 [Ophidiomyces ophidiicola]|nr:hypothetical protein LOZ11_003856 [Ophidiomyces ophidiicola]